MKFKLNKQEMNFLQQVLNAVYSYNIFNYKYLLARFKNEPLMLDKVYEVLKETIVAKDGTGNLMPKNEAFQLLAQANVVFVGPYYYEGIFLAQQKAIQLLPELIQSPDEALIKKDFQQEEKNKVLKQKHNKIIKYLIIADLVLGVLLLAKLLYNGDL